MKMMRSLPRVMAVAVFATMALTPCSLRAKEEELPSLKEHQEAADAILSEVNVDARRHVDIVFQLVDRLREAGQKKKAEEYLVAGLKHYPWKLSHQLIHAELLAEAKKTEEAREKATLVFNHAETEDLTAKAAKLLGKPPLPAFDKIKKLPGNKPAVVLVPYPGCNRYLLVHMRDKLKEVLKIPVHIQTIEAKYPAYRRDLRGSILNRTRRQLTDNPIWPPDVVEAMKTLKLKRADLKQDKNVLLFMRHMLREAGEEELAQFEAFMKEAKGMNPQWEATELREVMFRAVKPFRRPNVAYIAVTPLDIYAKDYNFLFGWANPAGAIMSYHRFAASFTEEPPNRDRLFKRALMQSLSSIGLSFEIKRCSNPTCARAYPNSLSEHDAKTGGLCTQCMRGFKKRFGQK